MTDKLSPAEFSMELRRRARTEGAEIAYQTAIALCKDPSTPAQARSAALNAILRMGGYFETVEDDASGKQPHEMTAAELRAEILRYQRIATGEADASGEVFD